MKNKLAAAFFDALKDAAGTLGEDPNRAPTIEDSTPEMIGQTADILSRFLANLAADLPDEMVEAGALAIAGLAKWDDSLAGAITRAKARSDAELALTAALTVEAE